MIEIPDLDDLSLNNYAGFNGFHNNVLDGQDQGERQLSPHQHPEAQDDEDHTPLTLDPQHSINSIQKEEQIYVKDSLQAQQTPEPTGERAYSKEYLPPSAISMPDSSGGSDILGETIALYNALASSTNIIARSRSQLPQDDQPHQISLDPVSEPSSQNPLDQEPEMISARLERIENEIDSRIEQSDYFPLQQHQSQLLQPQSHSGLHNQLYSHDLQSGISLGTEDSQNISSQRIDYVQTKNSSLEFDNQTDGLVFGTAELQDQTFKLQQPPHPFNAASDTTANSFHSDFNETQENRDQLAQLETPIMLGYDLRQGTATSLAQQFASPASLLPARNHVEPSPQLPAPMSTTSLQRLTLNNGEEFGSMRRDLATDSKTSAEYTLHIIFTQFVRHAERKLNLCLDYPLNEEPPILDLIAEGIDPEFDKIVSALGYIARRKPKPVIDSVMFWRKSKSEVATMAAAEVEKALGLARSTLLKTSRTSSSSPITPYNPGIAKNGSGTASSAISGAKRSLSLMRKKSLSRITHRRNHSSTSTVATTSNVAESDNEFIKQKQYVDGQIILAKETAIQADRKSLASIYILCRVLIEIVKQTPPDRMGDDLSSKLEEIVYTQLKTTDPISTSQSLVRAANWNLFAELLGFMSQRRFVSVNDRFIADLEKVPKNVQHEEEPKLYLLINGMRYLKLTVYPLEEFEECAEFIQSLAKFFEEATNETVMYAYCEVFNLLFLPLANVITAEANHPTWVEAIEKIYHKAVKTWRHASGSSTSPTSMTLPSVNQPGVSSNNTWAHALSLMTSSLSVSRRELFAEVWYSVIEENNFKLKPKVEVEDKIVYIASVTRLIWVYLNRLPDSLNNTIKRLDSIFELLFFHNNSTSKKQSWIVPQTNLITSLVELIRIVGYNHLNYTLEHVLIKLLNMSFNGTSLENSFPEKIIIVIKSYLAIIQDYEIGEKPDFPIDDNNFFEQQKHKTGDFLYIAKNSTNLACHDEICRTFALLLRILDSQYGCTLNGTDNNSNYFSLGSSKSQSSSSFGFHFSYDSTAPSTKEIQIELFAALIEAIPWTILADHQTSLVPFKQIVEVLVRGAVHHDARIASAAIKSLKHLACRKNPSTLMTIYAKLAFHLSDKTGPTYDTRYLYSEQYTKLLELYTELLNSWLTLFQELQEKKNDNEAENTLGFAPNDPRMAHDNSLNDLYQINHKNADLSDASQAKLKASDELEWKTIVTVIEDIEGNGLFFLCSQDPKTRLYGIKILRLVDQFDQAIYNVTDMKSNSGDSGTVSKQHSRSSSKFVADIGTRLIHILEDTDFVELIKPYRKELSLPERTRLTKLKNRKNILVRLAESDYGIDSTIWLRIYPKVLEIFFDKCPMPVAMCRNIVCVSLVQMHELILEFSDSYKSYTSSLFAKSESKVPPEVLVNQWRSYLIFACTTLTATNDQKISFPNQPTHGRKKSLQMFIQHQKITSAKSVFKMVLPLLRSSQPMVRESVILGLSHMNINIFKSFLENIPLAVEEWNTEAKKRDFQDDRFRIEVVHILANLTEKFKLHELIYTDDSIVSNLVAIVKNVKQFLSVPTVQTDIDFQRLRRYFCGFLENVYLGLQEMSDLETWLPFEARIGCFNYLKEWCGFGDCSAVTEDRYNTIINRINEEKDVTTAVAILELERKKLQYSALCCMSVLCSGEVEKRIEIPGGGKIAVVSFDIPGLMNWIQALLESDMEKIQEIGKNALKNIIENNFNTTEVINSIIRRCYISPKSTESYFCTFVDIFMERDNSETVPDELLCLAACLAANESFEVRCSAIRLMRYLEKKDLGSDRLERFSEAICSKSPVVYRKALFDLSNDIQEIKPDKLYVRISHLTHFFSLVSNSTRKDILTLLLPMVSKVVLNYDHPLPEDEPQQPQASQDSNMDKSFDSSSLMVLNNLFEITVKFGCKMSNEIEVLWISLGNSGQNFDKIIEYLLQNCLEMKNPSFVHHARQVINYLAFSRTDPSDVIDKFIHNLQPRLMVPPQLNRISHIKTSSVDEAESFPYVCDLKKVVPSNEKDAIFSLGQLSMVFLVDLITVKNDLMVEKLPVLLHISLSLLDHYLHIVQEQAGTLLIHLIHTLAREDPKARETIQLIREKDHIKYLWVYDDLNNDKKGARTPKNMDSLIRSALKIFSSVAPNIQEDWSRVSLHWATTCAVRHMACRSFQIFRSLLCFLDQGMLKDMLHRLSNTISDGTVDIQGFAMQILMTLNAITAELNSDKLIDYPQLFWSGVACLSTIHEQEFIEVLSTLNKFISKIDLDAPDTVSCLISTFPPKWEGKFEGLQQVILVGLRSASSWEPTLKFLDKLIVLNDSKIIGMGDSRILTALLANMPRFLHILDEGSGITPDIEHTAMAISKLAENSGKTSLAKVLVSFAKKRFRSQLDFLDQTIYCIKNSFFPEYEAQTLVLLLGLLSNKIPWVKQETLNFLGLVFPLVDLQRDEFVGVGADLISPLLRLLLTDYAERALKVLDEAEIISGSQLDKDILRMSLGNTSMKKEYENTATLFGIPDESGWSIPMPAVTAATTRNNVHAVFSTCTVTDVVDPAKETEIQFHLEDYYGPNNNNQDNFVDNVSVNVGEEPDASLSNVWAALDDFDSFFTKESEQNGAVVVPNRAIRASLRHSQAQHHHGHSASVDTRYSNSSGTLMPMESAPNVYDKKVSVILNRSLARTASNTSFRANLADSIGSTQVVNQHPNSKRSYIPFRSSKHVKNSNATTPVMQLSPGFEPRTNLQSPSSFQSPSVMATPTSTTINSDSTFTGLNAAADDTNLTRLEGLLGTKKRSKKSMTNRAGSPVNTITSTTSPELRTYNNYRNSHVSIITSPKHSGSVGLNSPAQLSTASNGNTNSTASGTPGSGATSKDKKRASQKFRQ
ncbi:Cell morphogenesis protein PAG1 [Candida viswanathii]|uniref:Cell morphogenesis protein PAG1 n=1 Tax=Candida viswanathii TaxID=5486 RepID=A0A367YPH5_9ASCO|nr:Cell morphogenesis protein PAG1 [Candida viswanathii]